MGPKRDLITTSRLLAETTHWAKQSPEIVALALVGSHARDAARPDSDVDLAVLCTNPTALLEAHDWMTRFGEVRSSEVEVYGPVRSLRVFYRDGLEVEFGLADPTWAAVPLDPGTRRVLRDGIRVLYDPLGILEQARHAAFV